MKKFKKEAFLTGAHFRTKDVDIEGLGVVTLREMSARDFNDYVKAATGKNKKYSEDDLTIMLIQRSIVDDKRALLFDESDRDDILDNMTGGQLQKLTAHILFFNGMSDEDPCAEPTPDGEAEKK